MEEKRISIKMGAKLKSDIEKLMLDDRERVLKKYILNIIKDYTYKKKYNHIGVKKENISYADYKHITFELSVKLDDRIEGALNELNRNRNEYMNMILTDYVMKKNR